MESNTLNSDPYSEIERSILHGLRLEWESVFSFIPIKNRSTLRPPTFSLKNAEKSIAHWDSAKRDIAFSRVFVLNHPWDAVKEVLVHEMAHQYATDVLQAKNEPPHGPSFHKACHILKANPKASGTYRPLNERLYEDDLSEKDRIMVKVKKLLALGTSLNEHEAQSAVAKAHDLIRKYNIELLEKDEERRFISVFLGNPALKHYREDYRLGHLLSEHYFVYGIWVPAYVASKGKMGRVFEITGTPENVKIASYVHGFISRHMVQSWDSFNRDKHLNRSRKSDFSTGLVLGFHERLTRERSALTMDKPLAQTKSLIPKDPRLTDYVSYLYPHVHHIKGKPKSHDEHVTNAGKDAGGKLVLNKAVETGHSGTVLGLTQNGGS